MPRLGLVAAIPFLPMNEAASRLTGPHPSPAPGPLGAASLSRRASRRPCRARCGFADQRGIFIIEPEDRQTIPPA